MLVFLATAIEPKWRKLTVVVFDASQAPPGLPREMRQSEMTIRFAPRKTTADDLLEDLIAEEREPKLLLVVSSDHRVQRAARQRGAEYIDSEVWYSQQVQRLKTQAESGQPTNREQPQQSPAEIADWLKKFTS